MSAYESLDELNVNTVIDDRQYKEFKFYNIEERLDLINNYLNKIEISEVDKDILRDLVKTDKLKNKTDILFDKVNKFIININLLECNKNLNSYTIKKKKEKNLFDNNKNILNKLIKC